MIRFIDLRGQDIGIYRFAFWDTVADSFVSIGGTQAWETKKDLLHDIDLMINSGDGIFSNKIRGRFESLMPEWTELREDGDDYGDKTVGITGA